MKQDCECFAEVSQQIKEQSGDPDATTNYALLMNGAFRPRMTYTYRKKKKSGEFHTKETEGSLLPTFCPFCGVKYPER